VSLNLVNGVTSLSITKLTIKMKNAKLSITILDDDSVLSIIMLIVVNAEYRHADSLSVMASSAPLGQTITIQTCLPVRVYGLKWKAKYS
jgi:hypothetical protein